jgi:hypothetical protein
MIVWRITGNKIGQNDNSAHHTANRIEADRARRAYINGLPKGAPIPDPPEKLTIKNREDLARCLNDAMGYGAS